MNFLDLNRGEIKQNSIVTDDYYIYNIGSPIEVTCIKANNTNKLISQNLSSNVLEDKFMMKYRPTNKIYFDREFIENSEEDFTSYEINKDTKNIYIGSKDRYKFTDGILVFSGFLSANFMVEKDRFIYGNTRVLDTIKNKVLILSVGVRNDMLYGLYYVMSSKGTAIEAKEENRGISVNTLKYCDCVSYNKFTIKDWFDGAKIKEID